MALVVKNLPTSAGDLRDPGGGHGIPLQCSCLENPMDRGAWQAAVHGVTESQAGLSADTRHAQLIYSVVLISALQQSDSVIHMYRHFFSYSFPLSFITAY